jgi:hypothetical protein
MRGSKFIIAACAIGLMGAGIVAAQDEMPGRLVRATEAIGMDVRSSANENLGDIQDIVLDQQSGRVAYAVLSFGGFLGIGDKLFAVPWAALKETPKQDAFVLDVPKDRLEKAPGFDKDKWPNLNDRQWGSQIHTYYGVKPYWEIKVGVIQPPANGKETSKPGAGQNGDGMGAEAMKTYTGRIETVQHGEPVVISVKTESGMDLRANLAPAAFLDKQNATVNTGDRISMTGFTKSADGQAVFTVTQFSLNGRPAVRLRQADGSAIWKAGGGEAANGMDDQARRDAGQPGAGPQALMTFQGTVTSIDDTADGKKLTLNTGAGQKTIFLGPESALERQNFKLAQGDTVEVKAFSKQRDGMNVVLQATQITKGGQTLKLGEQPK